MIQLKVFDISLAMAALAALFLVLPADHDNDGNKINQPTQHQGLHKTDSKTNGHALISGPSYWA